MKDEIQALRERTAEPPSTPSRQTAAQRQTQESNGGINADIPSLTGEMGISNPLFETSCASDLHIFHGESACSTFGDRLASLIDPEHFAHPAPTKVHYFRHPLLLRAQETKFELPNRIHASLLIERATHFVGKDYHFVLKKQFYKTLDRAYDSRQPADLVWTCSLFALLAIGELYSNCRSDAGDYKVPGTAYFLKAVSLLQDNYEEASLEHIQALNLLVSKR